MRNTKFLEKLLDGVEVELLPLGNDDFTTANKWVDFDFKVKSSAMKMITASDASNVLLKYVYYWLNTLPCELVDGDHKRQWIANFTTKRIPIPCPENPKNHLKFKPKLFAF